MSHDQLIILWFLLVAVLWIGFFFLEGFDFGVAMLYPVIGKDPTERRVMINTIGPTWDGNEVWLLTAGGAMFAAFPGWYSTLFSGLYVPLLLVLLGLIVRGVSFEYRALMPDDNWRDTFDTCSTVGSLIVPLVFGIGFANMWKGIPVDGQPPLMSGGFWSLFSPFALLGGVMLVILVHGARRGLPLPEDCRLGAHQGQWRDQAAGPDRGRAARHLRHLRKRAVPGGQ